MADLSHQIPAPFTAPLDPSLYSLDAEAAEFFKSVTGIQDDDELKNHILVAQKKAYDIFGYPCIHRFAFLNLKISRLPAYPQVIRLAKERPGAILLDIGCCFGNDLRKAVVDGWPVNNVVASDLRKGFWDAGHELFNSTPLTFPVAFIEGDALSPEHIAPREPFYESPTSPSPDLSTLNSLTPLQGYISAIHASSFIHVFNEEQQTQVCNALASLLSPLPGSTIFGSHVGSPQAGLRQVIVDGIEYTPFCHGPDSWKDLWDGCIFKKGAVKVETELRESKGQHLDGSSHILVWSVTRL